MPGAICLSLPDHAYMRQLRVLGAWWCLGSSIVDPVLLLRYRLAAAPRDHVAMPVTRRGSNRL